MNRFVVVVSSLYLLASSQLAHSRSIVDDRRNYPVLVTTVSCEPVYGFLPCATNGLGLLFMIVVYNILLSFGGKYVATGSDMWLQIIGPGVVGGSVFQFLGTIPQLVIVLLPLLTGSAEEAQARVRSGMGMVLGGVVILLTLIWGLTIVMGSSKPLHENQESDAENNIIEHLVGSSVVTDDETSWTARLVLAASLPYLILELQNIFTSSFAKKLIILFALIVTLVLLFAYIFIQPWIQNRCFEFIVDKYAKDKLLKLLTANGRPNTEKIQNLFNKIAKNNNNDNSLSVTPEEIRGLVLGVNTNLHLVEIGSYFDTNNDGYIDQTEFEKGMTKLVRSLLGQTTTQVNNISQNGGSEQEPLLSRNTVTSQVASTSWWRATLSLALGFGIALSLSKPLMTSIMAFAKAVNVSSFWVSYVVLPLALHYHTILQTINLASKNSKQSNSLQLSTLYGSVFMGNVISLVPFLIPVYFRDLSSDVSTELHLVVLICLFMGGYTSFNTKFPRWTGYVALALYPISLGTVYVLTSLP